MSKKKKKLTAIESKRVAVLKDAIAQIKAEKYKVRAHTGYVGREENPFDDFDLRAAVDACELFTGKKAKDIEFNKYLDRIITPKNPCQICAKGAMLISSIRKFNNFSLEKAASTDLNDLASYGGTYAIFGRANADKMETYFEQNDDALDEHGNIYNCYDIDHNPDDFKKWSDDYKDDEDRLIAIFQNAIRNKGTFKP